MAYVVAMTGGIGSGKTAVSDMLQALGATVVDTDVIAREMTAAGGAAMPAIIARFGETAAAPDGSLDRARMRALAFGDAAVKRDLEAILHPKIRDAAYAQVAAAAGPYVVVVVPLLVESNAYRDIADRILVVDCPEEVQIARTMTRSGLSRAEAERILAAQSSRAARLALATDVIVNDAGLEQLKAQVERMHQHFLDGARGKAGAAGTPE